MSSTNDQPPLTRRQVRDLERAREAGEAITGSISVTSGSPVPSAVPVSSTSEPSSPEPATREPASAPAVSTSTVPTSAASTSAASTSAPMSTPESSEANRPTSALEGEHQLTRRELRALREREAERASAAGPVPLRAPAPNTSRDLSDALSDSESLGDDDAVDDDVSDSHSSPRSAAAPVALPAAFTAAPSAPPSQRSASPFADSAPAPAAGTAQSREGAASEPVASEGAASEGATSEPAASEDAAAEPVRRSTHVPAAEVLSSEPVPSSVPTVFPFALSGSRQSAPEPSSSRANPDQDARADTPTPAASPTSSPSASSAPAAAAAAPVQSVGTATPAPAASAPATPARAASAPSTPAPATPAPSVATSAVAAESARPTPGYVPASAPGAGGYVPPVGHWSTQADVEEEDHGDALGGRAFRGSTGQQNALVLTEDQIPDVTGALNATGEIIITGSIDLPRSLAATGAHSPRIDGSDIDRLLEEGDAENADSDSMPVRASRAVSTHTSTRAVVLSAASPKGSRLPLILTICGAAVIVVIVGLVVVGFSTHIL